MFGDGAMVDEWFGETILYSESATLTNTFVPFGQLGAGVLRMLGRIHNVSISEADVTELGKGLASLPPHPDVPDGLRKLKAAGYRLVTLTDSPAIPGRGPLQAAGLADLFEQQFTAETVRRYKPARETYQMVARATGTPAVRAVHDRLASLGSHRRPHSRLLSRPDRARRRRAADRAWPQAASDHRANLTEIAAQLVQLKHA